MTHAQTGLLSIAAEGANAIAMKASVAGAHGVPFTGVEVGLQPKQPMHGERHQASAAVHHGNGQIHQTSKNLPRY